MYPFFNFFSQRRPGKIPMSGQLPHGVLPSLPHGLNQRGIHGLPKSQLVSQHGVLPHGALQSLPHGVNQLGALQSLHGIRVVKLIMTSIGSTQRMVIPSDIMRRDGIIMTPSGVMSSVKHVMNAVNCLSKIRVISPKLSVCHSMTVTDMMDAMVASIWTTMIIMD